MEVVELYSKKNFGWNVKHFASFIGEFTKALEATHGLKRPYKMQDLLKKNQRKDPHRKRRERMPAKGMMIHQDGSTHQWIEGVSWDLIITFDDADSEHYSMFFVEEEGTNSSFVA